MEVKKEPPGDFALTLPSDEDSAAEEVEEDDNEPLIEVKEEPQEEACLSEPLPSPIKDQPRRARARQCTSNHPNGEFKFKNVFLPPADDLPAQSEEEEEEDIDLNCTQFNVKEEPETTETDDPTRPPDHLVSHKEEKLTSNQPSKPRRKQLNRRDLNGIHDEPFACETCQKLYASKDALRRHKRQQRHGRYANSPEVTLVCAICDKSFSSSEHLKKHQKGVHDERQAKCKVCEKICKNRKALNSHSESHVKVECSICNKMITKGSSAKHLRAHSADNPFQCDLCEYSTIRKQSLNRHIERKHLEFICVACDANFPCQLLLKRHQIEVHGDVLMCDALKCETCQKAYLTNHSLAMHQRQKRHGIYANAPKVAFDCDKCDKTFSCSNHLNTHQKAVHDDKEAKCDVCGKIYRNRESLRHHSRTHIKVQCSNCSKMITKSVMAEHMQTHSADNPFECDLCEFSTKLKRSLREHMRRKHLKVKPVNDFNTLEDFTDFELPAHYFVDVNEDSTAEAEADEPQEEVKEESQDDCLLVLLPPPSDLLNQTITGEPAEPKRPRKYKSRPTKNQNRQPAKKFCCTKCSKEFETKSGLRNHSSSKKIHECAACNAKFACEPLLDRHRLECYEKVPRYKMFKCDNCQFRTINENLLIAHQTTHHEFSCSICQLKFTRRQHLTLHQVHHMQGLRTMEPEKVFDCDKCEKSFSNPKYLENHQASEHDGSEAKCDDCDKTFKDRVLLLIHRQFHDEVECPICHKMITARFKFSHLWSHSSKIKNESDRLTRIKRQLNRLRGAEQESFDLSPTEVKQEPEEEFDIFLPQSDDESTEPTELEEEDVEPNWALVEEELETDDSAMPSDNFVSQSGSNDKMLADSTRQLGISSNQSLKPHPMQLKHNSLATALAEIPTTIPTLLRNSSKKLSRPK